MSLSAISRNVQRKRNGVEVFTQKDEIRRIASDIGGGRGRNGDMRGGQRRRVVQAVPYHEDTPARLPEFGQSCGLVTRQDGCLETLNVQLRRRLVDGFRTITRKDLDVEAGIHEFAYCLFCTGAHAVCEDEACQTVSVLGEDGPGSDGRFLFARSGERPFSPPKPIRRLTLERFHAVSRDLDDPVERRRRKSFVAHCSDRPGDRVTRMGRNAAGDGQAFRIDVTRVDQ